jgi:tRNA threonylcarbamoyladenosine biosynthesis protein TsaB
MLILTIRTDKPEAEIGLYDDQTELSYIKWQAHRQLAETINLKIKELLDKKSLADVDALVVYRGPGSFTGLRIGISVANALADSLQKAIVSATGDKWVSVAIERLKKGDNEKIVLPEYGAPPHITKPKH